MAEASGGRSDDWDEIAVAWGQRGDRRAWRTVSVAVDTDLIERWVTEAPQGTDTDDGSLKRLDSLCGC